VSPGRLIPALAVSLACAACGSATTASRSVRTGSSPSPVQIPTSTPSSGREIFARDCQACHSLIGNESLRKQGGDMLGVALSSAQLLSYTRVMPPPRLTARQLRAVVDYVLRTQQDRRRATGATARSRRPPELTQAAG
jgi:mono/diheme cytochrome c family protein